MALALTTKPKRTAALSITPVCKRKSPLWQRAVDAQPVFKGLASRVHATGQTTRPGIQAKLKVGEPNDEFEQEADRVADEVIRIPDRAVAETSSCRNGEQRLEKGAATISPSIQRLCAECGNEVRKQPGKDEETLQFKKDAGRVPDVGSDLESKISALRKGGQPLPQFLHTFFEPRFGYDFSQVRLHTDAPAATAAQAVNAKAFTLGHRIVFGAGNYAPMTSMGKRLLAHELTHVVQQTGKNNLHARESHLDLQREPESGCPGLVSFTASGKDPDLSDKCKDDCRFELGCCPTKRGECGSSDTSGMVFKAVVKAEKNCKGELAFMQNLLSTSRRVTKSDGTEECIKADKPHRDGGIPWKGCTVSVNGPGEFTITSDDCPNRKLTDNPASVSITDSFKTFLLWKTEGARERRPIANVTWGWGGTVTRGKGTECASQYKIVSVSHTDGKGKASEDKPVSTPEVKDLKSGPCK